MNNRFSYIILIFTIVVGGIIYLFNLFGLVRAANEVYARFIALGLFIAGFLILSITKIDFSKISLKDFYQNNSLIIFSLTFLLSFSFIYKRISYYAIGIFAFAVLIHFIYNKKFYAPPKFFYFIFAYGLLLLLGTVGTQKGFHFPDSILSFFILPLAFCCFQLPKKTMFKIGEIFFKTGIIYLSISLLYWWFNFLYLNVNFLEWIGGKTIYNVQMLGWVEQALNMVPFQARNLIATQDVHFFNAHFFVNSWSYLFHPTTISIVLLGGLMTGFYLFFKGNKHITVSLLDLIIYSLLCFLLILLLQSRIGIAGYLLVVFFSALYFLKIKTKYFKIGLALCILLVCTSFILFPNKVFNYTNDGFRQNYRKIAMSYIKNHFWWGSGYGDQTIVLNEQAEKMKDILPESIFILGKPHIAHVHNQFLGNMVEYGIWGLIIQVALLAAIAYYAIKNRSYLLQTLFCFILCFMMVEEGEFILFLTFIMFFTAISESEKRRVLPVNFKKKSND